MRIEVYVVLNGGRTVLDSIQDHDGTVTRIEAITEEQRREIAGRMACALCKAAFPDVRFEYRRWPHMPEVPCQ